MALEEVLAVVNFFVATSVELVAAAVLLIMMMVGLELMVLLLLLAGLDLEML